MDKRNVDHEVTLFLILGVISIAVVWWSQFN